jgi:hypothetical protein
LISKWLSWRARHAAAARGPCCGWRCRCVTSRSCSPNSLRQSGSWPRLSTLSPIWFTVAIAAELASFTCNFALQRLALQTEGWFAVITAGLAGNAVTNSLPGGDAAGAAVQFGMLTTAGFDTDTAVGGLTTFSLLGVGGLLALPIVALPTILAGAPISPGLAHTALLGIAGFVLFAIFGGVLLSRVRPWSCWPTPPRASSRCSLSPRADSASSRPA